MKTVSGLIWQAAGSPAMECGEHGQCRTCGASGLIGMPFGEWVRPTFMDHDKLDGGSIVCHACQFGFSDRNDALTAMRSADKPQRMRNYSHFVRGGKWVALTKGEKAEMLAELLSEPDAAVVAVSGQKHLIFRARPGWWQIEETACPPFPDALRATLGVVEGLYRAGISKAEIETGRYSQTRILSIGLAAWQRWESALRPLRGTLRLQLAVYLAQRDEKETDGEPLVPVGG